MGSVAAGPSETGPFEAGPTPQPELKPVGSHRRQLTEHRLVAETPRLPRFLDRLLDRMLARTPRPAVRVGLLMWAVFSGRRVAGLAAEVAFWGVFSLPWIFLAFISGLGWVGSLIGPGTVTAMQQFITETVSRIFTPDIAARYFTPIIDEMFTRADLGVIGIAVAFWSGSRAFATFVQAISVINGEFGDRGYWLSRAVGLIQYLGLVLVVAVATPVIVVGPGEIASHFQLSAWMITAVTSLLALIVLLAIVWGMFHFAAVNRADWLTELPGAVLAVIGILLAGFGLTYYVDRLSEGNIVLGVLVAPIAVMVFVYGISLVALLGATFNAVTSGRDPFAQPLSGNIAAPVPAAAAAMNGDVQI